MGERKAKFIFILSILSFRFVHSHSLSLFLHSREQRTENLIVSFRAWLLGRLWCTVHILPIHCGQRTHCEFGGCTCSDNLIETGISWSSFCPLYISGKCIDLSLFAVANERIHLGLERERCIRQKILPGVYSSDSFWIWQKVRTLQICSNYSTFSMSAPFFPIIQFKRFFFLSTKS